MVWLNLNVAKQFDVEDEEIELFDDDDFYDEKEPMRFSSRSSFEHKLPGDLLFKIDGSLTGDINWNACSATGIISVSSIKLIWFKINSFTQNCGIKTLEQISFSSGDGKELLKYIESFVWYCCNGGIIVGSDTIINSTRNFIKAYGENYKFTEPVWNPNYTWNFEHKICLFYKELDGKTLIDYWG